MRTTKWEAREQASIGLSAFLLLIAFTGRSCLAQAQNPCFAFLRGDVTVTCGGQRTQITRLGDLQGFAVSDERATFAYTTSRIVRRTGAVTTSADTTTVIELKSGTSRTAEGIAGTLSTCGGIFSANARGPHPSVRDPMTGEVLDFQPYLWFRCSTDRNTVVGTVENSGGELLEGIPPKTKIASAGSFDAYSFNISPGGSKIAYHNGRLCIFSSPGPPKCIEPQGSSISDTPTVNDSGEALVTTGTGKECFYKDTYNFSPQRSPGAKADECVGIGYWKPGLQSIQVIEPLGRSPQWISPATAALLRKWAAQQGGRAAKGTKLHETNSVTGRNR